jgi:hypothetical protein
MEPDCPSIDLTPEELNYLRTLELQDFLDHLQNKGLLNQSILDVDSKA